MDLLSLQASEKDFRDTRVTRASKEAFAKVLAQENILVRYDSRIQTASFDLQSRVCAIPVWEGISRYLHDLLVVHEVGHALETPMEGWKNFIEGTAKKIYGAKANAQIRAVLQMYLNIVEDVRIDRKQKIRYPGCRKDYAYGYKELLVVRDLFGFKKADATQVDDLPFIDRANVYFKGGRENLNIKFTPEEQSWLLKMDATQTFEDVAKLSEELYLRDKKELENKMQKPQPGEGDEGGEEGDQKQDKSKKNSNKSGKSKSEKSQKSDQNDDEDADGEGSNSGEEGEEKSDKKNKSGGNSDADGDEEEGDDQQDSDGSSDKSEKGDEKKDGQSGKSKSKDKNSQKGDQDGQDDAPGSENDATDESDADGDDDSYTRVDAPGEKPADKGNEEQGEPTNEKEGAQTISYEIPDHAPAGGVGGGNVIIIPVMPKTVDALEEALKGFVEIEFGRDAGSNEYIYATVPTPNMKNILDDYKTVLAQWRTGENWKNIKPRYANWRRIEAASIGFLTKEFEMKKAAAQYKMESINKTGRLNMGKLHQYKFTDDLFLRNTTTPKGKNHGFVMFIDWSGSMSSNIDNTLKQMFSIATFCKRVAIPFDVYLFRDTGGLDMSWNPKPNAAPNVDQWDKNWNHWSVSPQDRSFSKEPGELDFGGNFRLRNILSSRMSVKEFGEAADALMAYQKSAENMGPIEGMTGTPLNAAIAAAPEVVKEFKARTRVEVVNVVILSDGDSDALYGVNGVQSLPGYYSSVPKGTNKHILQDKKLKRDYPMDNISSRQLTFALLKNLKDKTGCNLIGFYMCGANWESTCNYTLPQYIPSLSTDLRDRYKVFAQRNGFIPITEAGYDEYYFVFTQSKRRKSVAAPVQLDENGDVIEFEDDEDIDLNVSMDMDASALAKEMSESLHKKGLARVLLSRFIDLVAGTQGVKKKLAI